MTDPRRTLPGVDVLLASAAFEPVLARFPRGRVVDAVRDVLAEIRAGISDSGPSREPPGEEEYAARVKALLLHRDIPSLRSVINATGVVLHTNLGRAPLSEATREAMARAGAGYSNLEFDLERGERGSRYVHCVDLLMELAGAEDALVVNNNAAAVVLAVNTLAQGREVLVSRGELVEIGGGFRIPDMLSRSGAILREVGTTNKTRPTDYRDAADGGTVAAILKVHRSNFRMTGFTQEASVEELADVARSLGLFLLHDLGSGLFLDPASLGLPAEPRALDSLRAGVDAVAVSGDKLLGGPQAGILLGKEAIIERMRQNPLCRAFRVDKVTLAGLEATLRHYLEPEEALREIPSLKILAESLESVERRARDLEARLSNLPVQVRVAEGRSVVGGGTFPGVELPTWVLRLRSSEVPAEGFAERLRSGIPPVVGRREDDEVVLDLRTVLQGELDDLERRLREVLGGEA
jgi:L-seryl-tRNA(Ser) seleniumtransferase